MRAYPEIMLDLDFSDRVVDVIEEGFDAVVRFAEIGDSRLMTRARVHISPTPRRGPGLSGCGEGCPSDPGRPVKAHARACTTSFRPAEGSSGGSRCCPEHAGRRDPELLQDKLRGKHN